MITLRDLPIFWRILLPENQPPNNTPHTPSANNKRRPKRPAPLACDIIRLVGQRGRDVRIAAAREDKGAKVSYAITLCVPQERDADDLQDGVNNDDDTVRVVLVR